MSRANHYAKKNTTDGTDLEFVFAVRDYIIDTIGILPERIHRDKMLIFNAEGEVYPHVLSEIPIRECMPQDMLPYKTVARPDLVITDSRTGRPSIIVELDGRPPEFGGKGSYHTTQGGQKHDRKRNTLYEYAGLHLVEYDAHDVHICNKMKPGYKGALITWQKVINYGFRQFKESKR